MRGDHNPTEAERAQEAATRPRRRRADDIASTVLAGLVPSRRHTNALERCLTQPIDH